MQFGTHANSFHLFGADVQPMNPSLPPWFTHPGIPSSTVWHLQRTPPTGQLGKAFVYFISVSTSRFPPSISSL